MLDAVRDRGGFDVLVVELSSSVPAALGAVGALPPGAVLQHRRRPPRLARLDGGVLAAKAHASTGTKVARASADDDPADGRGRGGRRGARAIGFGLGVPGPERFGVVEGILFDRAFLDGHAARSPLDDPRRAGPRGVSNTLAAAALARSIGVPAEADRRRARHVPARRAPHRDGGQVAGVRWVDDSKATNPHAADASLRAFGKVVWIVGGLLKGVDADALVAGRTVSRLRGCDA